MLRLLLCSVASAGFFAAGLVGTAGGTGGRTLSYAELSVLYGGFPNHQCCVENALCNPAPGQVQNCNGLAEGACPGNTMTLKEAGNDWYCDFAFPFQTCEFGSDYVCARKWTCAWQNGSCVATGQITWSNPDECEDDCF